MVVDDDQGPPVLGLKQVAFLQEGSDQLWCVEVCFVGSFPSFPRVLSGWLVVWREGGPLIIILAGCFAEYTAGAHHVVPRLAT